MHIMQISYIYEIADYKVYMRKGTQEWEFFGLDFEFCTISLSVMHK